MADPREGRIAGPGQVVHDHPIMDGIACEVQHAVGKGEFTTEPGTLGVGIVILPTGQPRLIVQVKHADGTSLGATLKDAVDAAIIMECIGEVVADLWLEVPRA